MFKVKPAHLVDSVVCLCHAVLLVSMHCELIGRELKNFNVLNQVYTSV